jgi:cytochrome b subunit of formate dehydrogenase
MRTYFFCLFTTPMKTYLITAAIAIIVLALTGCQVTLRPDYEGIIQIIGGGEIPRAIIPTK